MTTTTAGDIMSEMPKLTERQRLTLDAIWRELRQVWKMHQPLTFDISFHDEVRPGQGHDVVWWCSDGDLVAQGAVDRFGGHSGYSVSELQVIHRGGGDWCECEHCTADLEAS